MSATVGRVDQLFPGPLAGQARAITKRLQIVFPPSRFQFKYLPANLMKAWPEMVQGNQPFVGLAFGGMTPAGGENRVFMGVANWIVLVAVRGQGKPEARYLGDAQGFGVTLMATTAAAVLHGFVAHGATLSVAKIANVMVEGTLDESAVLSVELRAPLTLNVAAAISRPLELGLFQEIDEIWGNTDATGETETTETQEGFDG